MKSIRLFTLAAIVLAGNALQAQDMSLDKILDAHFKAVGQKNILKLKSMVLTGKIVQMGAEMPFKIIQKRPAKFYFEAEIQGDKMKQGYDGKNGWMVAPMMGSSDPIDMTGPQLRILEEQADIDGYLWNWKDRGFKLEMAGKEDVQGSMAYHLKLTNDAGDVSDYWLDTDKYLIVKTKRMVPMQGQEMAQESLMSDYSSMNGIMMPHSIENRMNGQTMSTIVVDEFKFDEKIDDAMFSKPGSMD